MKPVLLIILVLVGGAGLYFSMDQQKTYKATIEERISLENRNDERKRVLNDTAAERVAADGEVTKWTQNRGEKQALVDTESSKNQALVAQMNDIETKRVAKQAEYQKIQDELDKYDFKDPQEIIDRNDSAQAKNKQLLASIDEMNVLVDGAAKKAATFEAQMDTLQKRQADYRKKLSSNSKEYQVVAVDPEWGFVVVNAGEDSTITPETVLLVSRAGKNIAKLKISSLEKRQTVADVIEGSLAEGNRVEVGDNVILLKPQG